MFDGLFEIFAKSLAWFYALVPNYAVAVGLLTLAVMIVSTPFTLKGTRSMIQMRPSSPRCGGCRSSTRTTARSSTRS
jgi:membrane protein insertase Oxa1/YidC/SpoIIIJ